MNKERLETNKIIKTLETNLSYQNLLSHGVECLPNIHPVMKLDFQNTLFSKNQKFHFPYTIESAYLIITKATFFTNSKDLLLAYYFKDALNLHASGDSLMEFNPDYDLYGVSEFEEENLQNSEIAKSELSQDDYFLNLQIATWSYADFILSATFFYLEYIHAKCLEKKLFLMATNHKLSESEISGRAFIDFTVFSSDIALLLLSKLFGKKLFFILKKTNIFLVYPEIWLYGFCDFIKNTGSRLIYDYESQNNKYFFNKIQQNELLNFSYIYFYLKAFDSLIPKKIRKLIYFISYNTKTVHLLYYLFKKYENILNNSIKLDRKEYNDHILNSKISYKLLEFAMEFEIMKIKGAK